MTITGWVSAATGLPCLKFKTIKGQWTVVKGSDLYHEWTAAQFLGTGKEFQVADPFAAPGVATQYTVSSEQGRTMPLTRATTSPRYANVTGLNGRGFTRCWFKDDGDETKWSSDVSLHSNAVPRWPLVVPARTGKGTFILWDEADRIPLWNLLRSNQPIIVSTGAPVLGVTPVRVVTVQQVTATRFGPEGTIQFDVDWTEVGWDSPMFGTGRRLERWCPVITWGDWQTVDGAWKSRTVAELNFSERLNA